MTNEELIRVDQRVTALEVEVALLRSQLRDNDLKDSSQDTLLNLLQQAIGATMGDVRAERQQLIEALVTKLTPTTA